MTYPLVRELAEDGIPVTVTCRVLGFSRKNYYRWLASPITTRDWENAHLTNAAVDAHRDDPNFGYRFIADELEQRGHRVSERRVWRLCSDQQLWSNFAKKKGRTKRAGPPVHDDLVQRDFSATRPNELWLTDITEHRTTWIPAVVATLSRKEGCCNVTKDWEKSSLGRRNQEKVLPPG